MHKKQILQKKITKKKHFLKISTNSHQNIRANKEYHKLGKVLLPSSPPPLAKAKLVELRLGKKRNQNLSDETSNSNITLISRRSSNIGKLLKYWGAGLLSSSYSIIGKLLYYWEATLFCSHSKQTTAGPGKTGEILVLTTGMCERQWDTYYWFTNTCNIGTGASYHLLRYVSLFYIQI